MRFARTWGEQHAGEVGAGRLVVCLHPLAASGSLWEPFAGELADRARVVMPDARGHGNSGWDGRAFSVPDLADDVAMLIRDLDAGPAAVVALSMGGCTAVALAVRHPELVDRLVLADTTADYGPGKEQAWAERAEKAEAVPRAKQLGFQVDRWFGERFRDAEPAEVDRVSKIFLGTDSRAHAAACRALGVYSDAERLDEITAPTLVLVGAEDYATPTEMARALHAGIGDSDLVELPATRHLSLVENSRARDLAVAHLLG